MRQRLPKPWFTLSVLTFLVLALTSCATTPQPESEAEAPSYSANANPDEQLAQIAERLPNFGGLFFDDEGVLTVYLTAGITTQNAQAQRDDALAVLKDVLGEARLEQGREGLEAQNSAPDIRILEGQYEVEQLLTWQAQLDSVLGVDGVVFTDLDEAQNRLVVGVEDFSNRALLERTLQEAGVPQGAVLFEETEPIMPLLGLRSSPNTTRGGFQINFGNGACTLGFHVVRAGSPGFITNSHCTKTQGGTEGTVYSQPGGRRIGVEAKDPGYFRGGKCPAGRRCRYSDSSFARYTGSSAFALGKIAKTTSLNSGALNVNGSFRITGEADAPIVGEILHKVGRTTGWTSGKVTRTCINVNQFNVNGDTGLTQLCQVLSNIRSGKGDSGSPVFKRGKSGTATLYGVLWGGGTFSTIGSIERDLGQLNTRPATVNRVRAKTLSGSVYNLRSGPGTNYSKVGTIGGGYTVVITCQERGEAITGPYGTTRLWNKLKNGKWITDAYIYSGSNGRLAKAC